MKQLTPLLLTFIVALIQPGCGAGFESASGEDGLRGGAVESALDRYIDDRVSASEGDNSDWRVIELEQTRNVTVEVWWDNPEVEGGLLIRGRQAGTVRKLEHVSGQRHEKLGPIELPEGKWYIRIQATSGSSGYTMRIATGDSSGGGLPEF